MAKATQEELKALKQQQHEMKQESKQQSIVASDSESDDTSSNDANSSVSRHDLSHKGMIIAKLGQIMSKTDLDDNQFDKALNFLADLQFGDDDDDAVVAVSLSPFVEYISACVKLDGDLEKLWKFVNMILQIGDPISGNGTASKGFAFYFANAGFNDLSGKTKNGKNDDLKDNSDSKENGKNDDIVVESRPRLEIGGKNGANDDPNEHKNESIDGDNNSIYRFVDSTKYGNDWRTSTLEIVVKFSSNELIRHRIIQLISMVDMYGPSLGGKSGEAIDIALDKVAQFDEWRAESLNVFLDILCAPAYTGDCTTSKDYIRIIRNDYREFTRRHGGFIDEVVNDVENKKELQNWQLYHLLGLVIQSICG